MSDEEPPTEVDKKVSEIVVLLSKMEPHQAHNAVLCACQDLIATLCHLEGLGVIFALEMAAQENHESS